MNIKFDACPFKHQLSCSEHQTHNIAKHSVAFLSIPCSVWYHIHFVYQINLFLNIWLGKFKTNCTRFKFPTFKWLTSAVKDVNDTRTDKRPDKKCIIVQFYRCFLCCPSSVGKWRKIQLFHSMGLVNLWICWCWWYYFGRIFLEHKSGFFCRLLASFLDV